MSARNVILPYPKKTNLRLFDECFGNNGNTKFNYSIVGFMIQGGDIVYNDMQGGNEPIYNDTFCDETL